MNGQEIINTIIEVGGVRQDTVENNYRDELSGRDYKNLIIWLKENCNLERAPECLGFSYVVKPIIKLHNLREDQPNQDYQSTIDQIIDIMIEAEQRKIDNE